MDYNEYVNFNSGEDNRKYVERWFESESWQSVLDAGERGDHDSVELMEHVNDQLASLIFHIKNDSGESRINYETIFFKQLCEDFQE